ncbi:hypothetical protein BDF21DRAFT_479884, partial [Thamnidium elegans]
IINSRKWLEFWQLEIPLPARTIWYRAIYNKIPTKFILHRFFPDKAESHNCLLCLSTSISEETADHFLFTCPSKKTYMVQYLYILHFLYRHSFLYIRLHSYNFIVIPTNSFRKGFHNSFTS